MALESQNDKTAYTESNNILEVRDASVSFEMDRGESRVLDSVEINIRRKETLGIVGESGSGKSMLASSLLDAVRDPGQTTGTIRYYPTEGSEPVNILDISDSELRQIRWEEISMVFQGAMSSFNPTMRIRTHFIETLQAHDADVEAGMERTHQLISDLYMDPERVLDSYPHELSGGMKQRALIALSLILEPEVLILDEPTASLDLLMQRSIASLLSELQDKYDLTMVFITHDLALVTKLADRLAVMYAFEIVELATAREIIQHAAHPYTRALLNATPDVEAPVMNMKPIEGSAPDPIDVPSGCSYHPRCPLADSECISDDPPLEPVMDGHNVACHHWELTSDEINLILHDHNDN